MAMPRVKMMSIQLTLAAKTEVDEYRCDIGSMLVTGADLAEVRVRLADYPFVRISADLSAQRISARTSAPRISGGYLFFYVLIFIPYYT